MKNQKCVVLILPIITLGSISCQSWNPYDLDKPGFSSPGPKARDPEYGWGFENLGDADIRDVCITWRVGKNTFAASAGYLSKGPGEKYDDLGWDPIPEEGTVEWRDNSGGGSQKLKIASAISDIEHFSGTILLVFDGNKWHVEPKQKGPPLDFPWMH